MGFNEGLLSALSEVLQEIFGKTVGIKMLAGCLSPPDAEIVLPRDLGV